MKKSCQITKILNNKTGAVSACPFCESTNTQAFFSLLMPTILSACSQDEVAQAKIFPFEASLCLNCGLGFNSKPLPEETLQNIYKNYRYVRPHKGIGCSKYDAMLQCIYRNTSKDNHLVEIGSSDGYLIDALVSSGYKNIEGIEPSKEYLQATNHKLIRNEFFKTETSFKQPVDTFFLMHVMEHFHSPRDIISVMKQNLSPSGKIIFEVPNFSGFHHQHLLFFNPIFVSHFARVMGLVVLEMEATGSVLRVTLQKQNNTKSVETEPMKNPEELKNLLHQANTTAQRYQQINEDLKTFLLSSLNKKVFWWGTGSTSIIALSNIDNNILQKTQIVVIDGDPERKGLSLPFANLQNLSIHAPSDVIKTMRKNDALVIASSFSEEILKKLKASCDLPEQIFIINL